MNLRKFAEKINELAEKYGDLPVVSANWSGDICDEVTYDEVNRFPSIGFGHVADSFQKEPTCIIISEGNEQ